MKKTLFVLIVVSGLCAPKFSFAATDEQNKQVLKDALVGAVTGAVATEATKDQPKAVAATPVTSPDPEQHRHWWNGHKKNFSEKKHHHDHDNDDNDDDHDKDKKRPHGWDMGKKTGWGDKDVPPGQAKKD